MYTHIQPSAEVISHLEKGDIAGALDCVERMNPHEADRTPSYQAIVEAICELDQKDLLAPMPRREAILVHVFQGFLRAGFSEQAGKTLLLMRPKSPQERLIFDQLADLLEHTLDRWRDWPVAA